MVGLAVPVMKNFKGFTQLIESVDYPVIPYIFDNWTDNFGVPKAWNNCIKRAINANEEFLIICNDDVTFSAGAIKRLIETLDEYSTVDLVSAIATHTGQYGYIDNDGPDFSCFAIRPQEFVNKFGFFDEHFFPAYFEDNDMTYRVKVSGGRQGICLDATIYHEGSATQYFEGKDNPVVPSPQFEANRAYYAAKWGGVPGEEVYTTPHNQPNLTIKDM